MLAPLMARSPRRLLLAGAAALVLAGCGEQGIQLAEDDPNYQGARIFNENCAGCHTLDAVGSEGSAVDPDSRELKDGPNFNERRESVEDVLYAIRNGGFSSGPMPQNIVTGPEAQQVAEFVAEYAGRPTGAPDTPATEPPTGSD
jgi:mono/diheme cytochrome c family protein